MFTLLYLCLDFLFIFQTLRYLWKLSLVFSLNRITNLKYSKRIKIFFMILFTLWKILNKMFEYAFVEGKTKSIWICFRIFKIIYLYFDLKNIYVWGCILQLYIYIQFLFIESYRNLFVFNSIQPGSLGG